MDTRDHASIRVSKIVDYAERIIPAVSDYLQETGGAEEYGGHLVVLEGTFGSTVLLTKLGYFKEDGCNNISDHNRAMQDRIRGANNAAWRTWDCSLFASYHIGRRPEFSYRAGAVRGDSLVFSFRSRHDQFLDEAAMFVLAIKLGQLREGDVLKQISDERNPFLRPLLEECR